MSKKNKNPYKVLYRWLNAISLAIFLLGLLSFLYLFIIQQSFYAGLAIFIAMSWATVFIGYFNWASYFYNINYGWTDTDWDRYFDLLEQKQKGEYVPDEMLQAPKENPYKNETFGFPGGTVRGMIALTLLFGALSLTVYSFGQDGNVAADAFYWDQFEFFKTAFLMMIAFYFGDKSLRYLKDRWNANREKNWLQSGGMPKGKNREGQDSRTDDNYGSKGSAENAGSDNASTFGKKTIQVNEQKKILAEAEAKPNPKGLIPIIDAGHGGLDADNNYVTAPSKMYTFNNIQFEYPFGKRNEIYEGYVNRKISKLLIDMLKEAEIPYYEQTVYTYKDVSLEDRVRYANEKFDKDKRAYLLSVHSNAAGSVADGEGTRAEGFEVYTSKSETRSDGLATIIAQSYKDSFPNMKFRQDMSDDDPDKEENFYVLRYTTCPAILVENLFFNNPTEAKFLMSESGQMKIATCLFNAIRKIHQIEA